MPQQFDELIPVGELTPGARVLDLGCGSGTVPYGNFPHLLFFGLDQYAHADTVVWPANACLVSADAERLPWANATFDLAICNFVFEHLRDPQAVLRELDRVTRPGGMLYVSIPRWSSLEDRLYRFATKGGGHIQQYSFETFLHLVYQESRFKLEGMGPAPGGFTWLQTLPLGNLIWRLLFRSFRIWQRATGNNPIAASDFLLLFRLGERRGFKSIPHVCSQCGNPTFDMPARADGLWKCPHCTFQNILVGP